MKKPSGVSLLRTYLHEFRMSVRLKAPDIACIVLTGRRFDRRGLTTVEATWLVNRKRVTWVRVLNRTDLELVIGGPATLARVHAAEFLREKGEGRR